MHKILLILGEYSDYMDEKEKAVIKNATPEIEMNMIIKLYNKKQISLENAASNLNMTVPEFEELLKNQRKSSWWLFSWFFGNRPSGLVP